MKTFNEYLTEKLQRVKLKSNPSTWKKGWWLDKDKIQFFHGTHKRNLEFIEKNGIVAPTEGSTAGWVSLALEPSTGHGYAAMSGSGGETGFRGAGQKAVNVPHGDRITFVIEIPKKEVLSKMAPERGAIGIVAASWRIPASQRFSSALVASLLQPKKTIGAAVLEAKRAERRRNLVEAYNLLGDPAMVLDLGDRQ